MYRENEGDSGISGEREKRRDDIEPRLRLALHVALLLAEQDGPEIVQA